MREPIAYQLELLATTDIISRQIPYSRDTHPPPGFDLNPNQPTSLSKDIKMSSNVGLSTPRGSGTSGYVQRNHAFIKPRNAGYGAPYPPLSEAGAGGFKQRQPDKKILEHDRMREVEVRVMEERERLEEENERVEEELENEQKKGKGKGKKSEEDEGDKEEGETTGKAETEKRVLSDEEIDERCEAFRARLLRDLDDDTSTSAAATQKPKDKKFKAYQVHELAEAKIEESERLRKALGIREDGETGEISSTRGGGSWR